MRWSEFALMLWVFLVSINLRGWAVDLQLGWWILLVGVAFIILRVLEWLGVITRGLRERA